VPGLSGVTTVAASDHSVALLSDGTLRAWGRNNYGQLGNGTFTHSDEPVTVSGLSGVIGIAAGDHTVALLNDGTLRAWGRNDYGERGRTEQALTGIPPLLYKC